VVEPLVSIITPSYNQASFLERTIQSVLYQDYPVIEYIIIDGASTDNSLQIIRKYEDQLASWISEPDQGQAEAINKGFAKARGDIIAWLNSDDLLIAGAVSEAVQALADTPEAGMVYGDGILIDEDDRILDWHPYQQYDVADLLKFNVLLQPAVFMRREVLDRVGWLDIQYNLILDHELWVRIAASSSIVHVPSYWAAERTYPDAKTRAMAAGFVEEAYSLIRSHEFDPKLGPIIQANKDSIDADLATFAGRRLIDAAHYRSSLKFLLRAMTISPAAALKYWYKYIQALMGLVGLERIFIGYRNLRRRIVHANQGLTLTKAGMVVGVPVEDQEVEGRARRGKDD
jgi:glycosyltransferase involved in cell wall biosynthesis